MKSTRRCTWIVALCALACSGCTIPVLKNPLVKPAEAKAVDTLCGVYRSDDCPTNFIHYVHVGPAGGDFPAGFVRIVSVMQPRDKTEVLEEPMTYIGFVEPIGKYHILHLPLSNAMKDKEKRRRTSWNGKWDENEVAGYLAMRLLIGDAGVEMAMLDGDVVKEQIRAKALTGEIEEKRSMVDGKVVVTDGPVMITEEMGKLRDFFSRHIDGKLFEEPHWKFERVK